MKRRLYYLTDSIDTVGAIAEVVHREGISDLHFHVVSKDEAGLYKHHLHSASPLLSQDVVRFGERGALIGLLAGVAVAALVVGVFQYFQTRPLIAFAIITVLVMMHGAWTGGMAGLANDHYKIKRFHRDIEAGRYLVMIDVAPEQRAHIQSALRNFDATPQGEDSTFTLPFNLGRS